MLGDGCECQNGQLMYGHEQWTTKQSAISGWPPNCQTADTEQFVDMVKNGTVAWSKCDFNVGQWQLMGTN